MRYQIPSLEVLAHASKTIASGSGKGNAVCHDGAQHELTSAGAYEVDE